MVFDLRNPTSFASMQEYWLEEIEKYGEGEVQLVAIANKADLEDP